MKIGRFVCQDGGTSKIENERKLCGVPGCLLEINSIYFMS